MADACNWQLVYQTENKKDLNVSMNGKTTDIIDAM